MSASERLVQLPWRQRLQPGYAVAVAAFALVLAVIASRPGQFQPVHQALMAIAALGLIYSLLVQVINVTTMRIEADTLHIEHGPLPWRGAMALPVARIRSLRCDRSGRRLLLLTDLGEEHIVAEALPAAALDAIDEQIRAQLALAHHGGR